MSIEIVEAIIATDANKTSQLINDGIMGRISLKLDEKRESISKALFAEESVESDDGHNVTSTGGTTKAKELKGSGAGSNDVSKDSKKKGSKTDDATKKAAEPKGDGTKGSKTITSDDGHSTTEA